MLTDTRDIITVYPADTAHNSLAANAATEPGPPPKVRTPLRGAPLIGRIILLAVAVSAPPAMASEIYSAATLNPQPIPQSLYAIVLVPVGLFLAAAGARTCRFRHHGPMTSYILNRWSGTTDIGTVRADVRGPDEHGNYHGVALAKKLTDPAHSEAGKGMGAALINAAKLDIPATKTLFIHAATPTLANKVYIAACHFVPGKKSWWLGQHVSYTAPADNVDTELTDSAHDTTTATRLAAQHQ